MSQDYVHARERAELLGLPIPSEEEWNEKQRAEAENHEDDEIIQKLDSSDEAANRVSGGLDELNTILNATQKKINRFKTVCGSLGSLLKVRMGSRHNTPNHKPSEPIVNESKDGEQEENAEDENLTIELSDDSMEAKNIEGTTAPAKKVDINEKMGSHLDKLDSLITKAENAQYSMQHQKKQMRKFLK